MAKVSEVAPEKPSVRIDITPAEAQELAQVLYNVGGVNKLVYGSDSLYVGLGKLGYAGELGKSDGSIYLR
jgi:hypothetical protein